MIKIYHNIPEKTNKSTNNWRTKIYITDTSLLENLQSMTSAGMYA